MSTLYVNNIEPVSGSSLILISASLVSVDSITTPSFTSSFQGDLQGTASFATTASFALNSTPPGGTEGQIQFNSGSIFGADSNLFWDNTNKRLGVGTNAPTRALEVRGSALIQNVSGTDGSIQIGANMGGIVLSSQNRAEIQLATNARMITRGTGITFRANSGEPNGAVLGVVGSGTTAATTSLLVQNSAGAELVKVLDDGSSTFQFTARFNGNGSGQGTILEIGSSGIFTSDAGFVRQKSQGQLDMINTTNNFVGINQTSVIASAMFAISSTNRGFLPPRMTTTQKNAISSPAAGLEVYDATVSGSYFHDGSSWRNVIAGDDTNLVWDNTNKRLGVGTNVPGQSIDTTGGIRLSGGGSQTLEFSNATRAQFRAIFGGFSFRSSTGVLISNSDGDPTARLHVRGSGTTSTTTSLLVQNSNASSSLAVLDNGAVGIGLNNPSASLHVRGSGSTSATTALLVENSAGTDVLKVQDNSVVNARGNLNVLHPSIATRSLTLGWGSIFATDMGSELVVGAVFSVPSSPQILLAGNTRSSGANTIQLQASLGVSIAASVTNPNASAQLDISSTTKGFLPPRMTTTEKNAIATPAAGLEVYDATVSGSYFHDGSSWRNVIAGDDTNLVWDNTNKRLAVGFNNPSASLHIRGSSTGSATTALLVQNSAGANLLNVRDDLSVLISSTSIFGFGDTTNYAKKSSAIDGVEIAGFGGVGLGAFGGINTFVVRSGSASLGATTANASAILDIVSTTKGVLFPRMTTTQKNAISSPASGIQVYDTTLNQMSYYNGTSWVNF